MCLDKIFGGLFKQPKVEVPPMPEPPTPPEPQKEVKRVRQSQEETRKRAALLSNTVSTSPQGLLAPAPTAKKTLLGQ